MLYDDEAKAVVLKAMMPDRLELVNAISSHSSAADMTWSRIIERLAGGFPEVIDVSSLRANFSQWCSTLRVSQFIFPLILYTFLTPFDYCRKSSNVGNEKVRRRVRVWLISSA